MVMLYGVPDSGKERRENDSMRCGVAGEQEESAANAKAGAAVVQAGILRDRWEPGDALGIAFCFIEGVSAVE
jgi:hypothetical protein